MSARILFVLFCVIFCKVKSQDSLYFRNGTVKIVKLLSSSSDQVTYMDNDSITYIISKANLYRIKHSGGALETIEVRKKTDPLVIENKSQSNQSTKYYEHPDKIHYTRTGMARHGRGFGERGMFQLIIEAKEPEAKKSLATSYYKMKEHQKKQYLFGFGGPFGGGALVVISYYVILYGISLTVAAGATYLPFLGLAGLLVGVGVLIAGLVISKINKNKRLEERDKFVHTYNKTLE